MNHATEIELHVEVDRLKVELAEIKRQTWCAYCGEGFPLDTVTADQVGEHIRTCPKHPMRVVEAELKQAEGERDDFRRRLDRRDEALRKYGRHQIRCTYTGAHSAVTHDKGECTCGLDHALCEIGEEK